LARWAKLGPPREPTGRGWCPGKGTAQGSRAPLRQARRGARRGRGVRLDYGLDARGLGFLTCRVILRLSGSTEEWFGQGSRRLVGVAAPNEG